MCWSGRSGRRGTCTGLNDPNETDAAETRRCQVYEPLESPSSARGEDSSGVGAGGHLLPFGIAVPISNSGVFPKKREREREEKNNAMSKEDEEETEWGGGRGKSAAGAVFFLSTLATTSSSCTHIYDGASAAYTHVLVWSASGGEKSEFFLKEKI